VRVREAAQKKQRSRRAAPPGRPARLADEDLHEAQLCELVAQAPPQPVAADAEQAERLFEVRLRRHALRRAAQRVGDRAQPARVVVHRVAHHGVAVGGGVHGQRGAAVGGGLRARGQPAAADGAEQLLPRQPHFRRKARQVHQVGLRQAGGAGARGARRAGRAAHHHRVPHHQPPRLQRLADVEEGAGHDAHQRRGVAGQQAAAARGAQRVQHAPLDGRQLEAALPRVLQPQRRAAPPSSTSLAACWRKGSTASMAGPALCGRALSFWELFFFLVVLLSL